MSSLRRAWTAFRSRPGGERIQLLRRALARLRSDGLAATLSWARASRPAAIDADLYEAWCRRHTPDDAELAGMRARAAGFARCPLISIVTAAYNTRPAWLEAAAASVLAQAYSNWEWHIVDDGSTDPATVSALDRLGHRDPRIHLHRAAVNGGISAATNVAVSRASGQYVALMDHDDELLPHALFRIVDRLNASDPPPDVIYSDEDKLDQEGRRCDPYFKPDWSPDLFRSSMYACHLLVIRRSLIEAVGGFRSAFDFSQDYDLLLRVIERTDRIAHVPDVLYHWRKAPHSTALAGEAKPAAHRAGALALQAHLDRQGIPGHIVDAGPPGLYGIRYQIPGRPLVSIIVPTRAAGDEATVAWISALARATAYPECEVVLVSDGASRDLSGPGGMRLRRIETSGRSTIAARMNDGARGARGHHLLFLHELVQPMEPDWLHALLELSVQPWVGAVGGKLFARDGSLRHIGLILGLNRLAGAPFEGFGGATVGYYSSANCIRNYSAVSGACLMTRRDVFDQLGGFDARAGAACDVDYGLRVDELGLRVVFTPYARLIHCEAHGVTDWDVNDNERAYFLHRWGARLLRDPFYNTNLSTRRLDYGIKTADEESGPAQASP